tara:strand:- start:31 stop:507 length:477 start_codon:yes stop_codon:yes gene_type:complete
MMREHDFKNFPELPNSMMDTHYWESPHKQIFEDFDAKVTKVVDGDTVRLEADFRDFDFPLRILGIDTLELNEGGQGAKEYLKDLMEGEDVRVIIDPKQRVEKWGRLLGDVMFKGTVLSEDMLRQGYAVPFERRREGQIEPLEKIFNMKRWSKNLEREI